MKEVKYAFSKRDGWVTTCKHFQSISVGSSWCVQCDYYHSSTDDAVKCHFQEEVVKDEYVTKLNLLQKKLEDLAIEFQDLIKEYDY